MNLLNLDKNTPATPYLPFIPGDLDRSGIRLTRAEFSRFLGVSKTAVTDMVKSGKITVDSDGRLDPRQAISQLLRNSDPARLRSKVLAPLMRDVGTLQKRIADLEAALAAANEDADFHEGASLEFLEQLGALRRHLENDRVDLANLPAHQVITAVITWLEQVVFGDGDLSLSARAWENLSVLDCIASPGAPDVEKGEGG